MMMLKHGTITELRVVILHDLTAGGMVECIAEADVR